MRKLYWVFILISLALVLIFALSIFGSKKIISLESANSIAQEKIKLYYPDVRWNYVDGVLLYDYEGDPARYYLLFIADGSNVSISSMDELPNLITNISDCYISNYCPHNFLTVAVRAYGGYSNVVTRNYRGIPFFIGDRIGVEGDVLADYPNKKLGRAIAFVQVIGEPVYYNLIDKSETITNGPLSEDTEIVEVISSERFNVLTISQFLEHARKIAEEMKGAAFA